MSHNPFRTKEFRSLRREWLERLSDAGFDDHEDERGNLRQYDRRTSAFECREQVFDFYRRLDHYLTEHPEIPETHRKILELYSAGKSGPEIVREVGRCRRTVQAVFYRVRRQLIGR